MISLSRFERYVTICKVKTNLFFKVVFDLVKAALEDTDLDALLEIYLDHKKFEKTQGMDLKYTKTLFILLVLYFLSVKVMDLGYLFVYVGLLKMEITRASHCSWI